MTTIAITLDGQPATTAVLAAARHNMQPQALRHTLARAGIHPAGMLDDRTPLYFVHEIEGHLATRPGKAWRKGCQCVDGHQPNG